MPELFLSVRFRRSRQNEGAEGGGEREREMRSDIPKEQHLFPFLISFLNVRFNLLFVDQTDEAGLA